MKIKTFLAILILLILVSGCRLITPRRPEPSEPEKIEYRVGTKALEMSFLKNFPPDQIKAGREFQVLVEIKNQGAYDIDNLILSLTGLLEQTTKIIEEPEPIETLPGKSINFPEGSKEIISFKIRNEKRLPVDRHTELIKIDACYPYKTIASADICINPTNQMVIPQTPKTCPQNQQIGLTGGQGAPIAVTRIEQTTTPTVIEQGIYELELKFHISNLGTGTVFQEEGCKKGGILEIEDISFHNYKLGSEIDCGFELGNQTLALEQRDNVLTCTANIYSAMGTFTTPSTITLNYWYKDGIEKTIEILKAK